MSRATFLWLFSLAFFLVFLALQPLFSYALFGSDTGEYYRLTAVLLSTGHLPHGGGYLGWGAAYPDFPGILLLSGAAAGAYGTDALTALIVVIPVVAVLSVFPLFLLFRRLFPQDTIALLAAAISSLAMPRLFSIAHPAPLSIGDFLVVAALWMLVEGRRDLRWYVPLSLTSAALIVTHHLSSYFFVVSALGGILLLELWRPGLWSRRYPRRELAFLAAFLTGLFLFWFYGTTTFVSKVIIPGVHTSTGVGFAGFEAAGLALIALVGGLIALRRQSGRTDRPWVRLPTDRSVLRDAVLIAAAVFGGVLAVVFIPIPGTSQTTTVAAILFFAPILALSLFGAGSRRVLTPARMAPFSLTWLGALGFSALGWLIISTYLANANFSQIVPAARHVEYLFLPLGLLFAVGIGRLVARAGDRYGRRAIVVGAVAVVLLLGANAAIVYPPQNDFGGFQEGLTVQDAALWMWVGIDVPSHAAVASDHRLSSMIFGFDGNNATWDSTPALFTGSNWTAAAAELRGSPSPSVIHPISYVAVDAVMYAGVALNPTGAAPPLSAAAIAWLSSAPFVLIYENAQQAIYLVDTTYLPPT
ncbi:MAG: hypothetical protein WB778_07095 [Thermoplasmata archaeon]